MCRKLMTILATALILAALAVVEQRLVSHLTDDALARTSVILGLIREGEMETALQKARELDLHWDDHAGELEVMVDRNRRCVRRSRQSPRWRRRTAPPR